MYEYSITFHPNRASSTASMSELAEGATIVVEKPGHANDGLRGVIRFGPKVRDVEDEHRTRRSTPLKSRVYLRKRKGIFFSFGGSFTRAHNGHVTHVYAASDSNCTCTQYSCADFSGGVTFVKGGKASEPSRFQNDANRYRFALRCILRAARDFQAFNDTKLCYIHNTHVPF